MRDAQSPENFERVHEEGRLGRGREAFKKTRYARGEAHMDKLASVKLDNARSTCKTRDKSYETVDGINRTSTVKMGVAEERMRDAQSPETFERAHEEGRPGRGREAFKKTRYARGELHMDKLASVELDNARSFMQDYRQVTQEASRLPLLPRSPMSRSSGWRTPPLYAPCSCKHSGCALLW